MSVTDMHVRGNRGNMSRRVRTCLIYYAGCDRAGPSSAHFIRVYNKTRSKSPKPMRIVFAARRYAMLCVYNVLLLHRDRHEGFIHA